MDFTAETKLKEVALSSLAARRVLEDAQVDYCCGGARSLQEACSTSGVSAEELIERLRQSGDEANPAAASWVSAPLSDLTRHIRETHHRYVRSAIVRIRELLDTVRARHGAAHAEIGEIQRLFTQLGSEMIMHMQKEEQILFPYIDSLEQAASGNSTLEPPFFRTVRNPIQTMLHEHDSAGELARQIRKASSDYTVPSGGCPTFQTLYDDLKQFEADLHQHVHLENNILFPRALETEASVL